MDRNKINNLLRRCRPGCLTAILILAYIFLLSPENWFNSPCSTVVYDKNGELLGARLATDEQWRFPEDSSVSFKIEKCILNFEDEYFYVHPGFNPVSILKALGTNISHGRIVRGGSTITMQLCRLYRKDAPRTVFEKFYEIILSTRIELHFAKKIILQKYLANAPFGGNIVGLEAASWRYFGRASSNLSWAEAATLAVLPNSPALIHPGRNRTMLLEKRNRLLLKLYKNKIIKKDEYQLAILESIPERPSPLPSEAKHVVDFFAKNKKAVVHTSIDRQYQQNLERICREYLKVLAINKIENIAAIILDVKSNSVLAYAGNICQVYSNNSPDVDIIQSPRSTGSVIKPILYGLMLQDGKILPTTLIPDIPTRISGFNPNNYDESFNGAVPARLALSRSLNIPVVRMLQTYGVERFYNALKQAGMTTLNFGPDHYGLTLVVGGAEGKLFDLAGMYSNYSRVLNDYNTCRKYSSGVFSRPSLLKNSGNTDKKNFTDIPAGLDAGSIYLMFDALLEVNRPDEDSNWKNLFSSRRVAWKTGTSYGFRDAWAIGTTPEFVVGIWVGNASGEGRPGLTGIATAAPLMFNVFSSLPKTSWFKKPYDELSEVVVCRESGFKAGRFCSMTDTVLCSVNGIRTGICPYHKLVHLTNDRKFRITVNCMDTMGMVSMPWFVLPPAQEWYYKKKDPFYKMLPPLKENCGNDGILPMEIVFPAEVSKVYIPKELDGTRGKLVLEVAHRDPGAELFWHLDDQFLTETHYFHQVAIDPAGGWHKITIMDGKGNILVKNFQVMD